jgi:DNA-binding SARP family transcriptional activator
LQSLGESAVTAGKVQEAVRWWRRAADLDPFDSAVALALVRALEGAGDRPGALRHARQHADTLRTQLGVSPDPAFGRVLSGLEGAV